MITHPMELFAGFFGGLAGLIIGVVLCKYLDDKYFVKRSEKIAREK